MEGVRGDARAEQVAVLAVLAIYALAELIHAAYVILIEAQPTAFGLELHPAVDAHIDKGADTIKAVGAGLRVSVARIIGLED